MIAAMLLVYAVGLYATALYLCRDEEYGMVARLELMALWPCYLVAKAFV